MACVHKTNSSSSPQEIIPGGPKWRQKSSMRLQHIHRIDIDDILNVVLVRDLEFFGRPANGFAKLVGVCLLYTSPSPRDQRGSRMPSSA